MDHPDEDSMGPSWLMTGCVSRSGLASFYPTVTSEMFPTAERGSKSMRSRDALRGRAPRCRARTEIGQLHGPLTCYFPNCRSSANYACSVVACDSWCHGFGYKMPGLLRVETWSTRVNPRTQFAENASHGQASVLLVGYPPACLSNVIVRHRSPPLTLLDGEC